MLTNERNHQLCGLVWCTIVDDVGGEWMESQTMCRFPIEQISYKFEHKPVYTYDCPHSFKLILLSQLSLLQINICFNPVPICANCLWGCEVKGNKWWLEKEYRILKTMNLSKAAGINTICLKLFLFSQDFFLEAIVILLLLNDLPNELRTFYLGKCYKFWPSLP